jgi:hypothetical protein
MKHGLRRCATLAVLFIATSCASAREPQDKSSPPADMKALDAKVFATLRDVINRGADLYNSGELSACYRVYEGSLMTIRPLIEHRPELQKAITAGIASAERDPLVWRRAFTLRNVLDKIRNEVNPKKVVKEKFPPPTQDDKGPGEKKPIEKIPEKKAEDKKPIDKKPIEKKPVENKAEDKKPIEKKSIEKETEDKKPIEKKPVEKKGEEKKDDDKLPLPKPEEKKPEEKKPEKNLDDKKAEDKKTDDKLPLPKPELSDRRR